MTKDEVKKLRMNSPESLQFLNNATKFYNLMMMYRCAIREIQTKLEVLDDEFSVENNRNPISFIKTRIKQPNSIYDKLQKMGYEFTTENIQTYLNDVAGVRIVCAFIDDIYMISDLITQQDDIKVIEIKDYIKNPKSNGYRSYHMIVEIPVFFAKGKTPMRVELQIRTNGMDFWTKEEYLKFIECVKDKPISYYAFQILYWCGIREGELLALTPADIDFENKKLHITKSYQYINGEDIITDPKTEKSRRDVVIPDFLVEELRQFIGMLYGYGRDDRIFQITKSYLHHEMSRGAKAAGVKRIRIHDLRHSHISLLIRLGFSAVAIGNRVGHESQTITFHYAHMFPTEQIEMADKLNEEFVPGTGNGGDVQ